MLDLAVEPARVLVGLHKRDWGSAHFRALGVDRLPAHFIEGDGIGGEVHPAMLPGVVLHGRAGATVRVTPSGTVMSPTIL